MAAADAGRDSGADAGGDSGSAAREPGPPPEPLYYFVGDCEGIYVYIVAISVEDPRSSSASLSLSPKERGYFRSVGDRMGRFEVMAITDDWSGLEPRVWLRDGDEVCRARMLGNAAREKQAQARAAAQARKKKAKRRKRPGGKRRRRR